MGERRRIAAERLGLSAETFRKNHEPDLVGDVAAEIYRLEHEAPEGSPDTPDAIVAVGSIGVGEPELDTTESSGAGEPPVGTSPVLRAMGWARRGRRSRGGDQAGELTGHEIPQVPVPAAPSPAQLYWSLEAIRDRQATLVWLAVGLLGGVVVVWWWGLDAVPLYVVVLATVALGSTALALVTIGRGRRVRLAWNQTPKIVLSVLAGGLGLLFIANSDSDETNRARATCLTPGNPACTTSTTGTTIEVPASVPVTFAVPQEPVEPECPPADNTERRLSFTGVPPRCIRPDAIYIADVETNYGTFQLILNAREAPAVVNNFVFLARWRFYDGVVLTPFPQPVISSTFLDTTDPVADQHEHQTPGYGMVLDRHEGPYPEGTYAIVTNPGYPHRWALVIAPEAHEQIAAEPGAYPVLGQVTDCEDIISDPNPDGPGLQPRITSTPIVIETIRIHELPPGSTTSSTRMQDPQCRERHQAAQ